MVVIDANIIVTSRTRKNSTVYKRNFLTNRIKKKHIYLALFITL